MIDVIHLFVEAQCGICCCAFIYGSEIDRVIRKALAVYTNLQKTSGSLYKSVVPCVCLELAVDHSPCEIADTVEMKVDSPEEEMVNIRRRRAR